MVAVELFQEIALSKTVPQTDTGGLAEKAKVSGITIVKELCKLTP